MRVGAGRGALDQLGYSALVAADSAAAVGSLLSPAADGDRPRTEELGGAKRAALCPAQRHAHPAAASCVRNISLLFQQMNTADGQNFDVRRQQDLTRAEGHAGHAHESKIQCLVGVQLVFTRSRDGSFRPDRETVRSPRKEGSMFMKSWRRAWPAALALPLLVCGGMAVYAGSSAAQSQSAAAVPASGSVILLTPSRIADSRIGESFGTFHAQQDQDLQIAGRGGVPLNGVSGAVLNVTVVGPQSFGFLTVWPFDVAQPGVSNINFTAGQTIANTVMVHLPVTDGTVRIFNGSAGDVDVVVDVEGYVTA